MPSLPNRFLPLPQRQQGSHWSDLKSIPEIMKTHPGLVSELKRYSYDSVVKLTGAFLAMPQFHANVIRFEVLAHLACVACVGSRRADRETLVKCAGRYLADSPLAQMEDPVEDVFIGNVATNVGNFRIFRGIHESGDFWLQRALFPFNLKNVPTPIVQLFDNIKALLCLSEIAANRLGLERYSSGAGTRTQRLTIPRWRDLLFVGDSLYFTAKDLQEAGISEQHLAPFILSVENQSKLANEVMGHTQLERFPLVRSGDGLVLALPHAVISCILRFLVERLIKLDFLDTFDSLVHGQQWHEWITSLRFGLGLEIGNISLPKPPADLPEIHQTVMMFDIGKFAHIVMLDGNLRGYTTDANAVDELTTTQTTILGQHLNDCAGILQTQPDFTDGITLISRGGFGRAFMISMEKSDKLNPIVATLADWQTLSRCKEMSALRLWRMWKQKSWAETHDLTINNANGLLNLFGFWRANQWRFLIRDMALNQPHKMLVPPIDMITGVREEVRRNYDGHSCPSYDSAERWIYVERKSANAYFTADKRLPLYIALDAAKHGKLLGAFETRRQTWWISCEPTPKTGVERHVLFQLWECLASWTAKAVPVFEKSLNSFPEGCIQLSLDVHDLDVWAEEEYEPNTRPLAIPSVVTDVKNRSVRIVLSGGFKYHFHVPDNSAERILVDSLLSGCAALTQTSLTQQSRDVILGEIFPNNHARYFHLVVTDSFAQALSPYGQPDPDFIPEEDCSQSLIGLALEIGDVPSSGFITGQNECLSYLEKVNSKLWERVESHLKQYSRDAVVMSCFTALAELERDADRWKMTARALLNLHPNSDEVFTVARDNRSKNDAASLMTRLLIETAMYAAPENGGRPLPRAERLELLAHLRNLVSSANHRDAISGGFMSPTIHIFPNGELDVDDDFYQKVVIPYVSARAADNYRESATKYERWFPEKIAPPSPDALQTVQLLEQPFVAEFGFSLNQLVEAAHALGRHAVEKKVLMLEIGEPEFLVLLHSHCAFTPDQAAAYIHVFTLPPRSAWDADLPAGCAKRDVYPWRFRRRLSLLMRPLVLLSIKPEKRWLIYPPLLEKSGAYLLHNLAEGAFPVEYFHSGAMRQFWGDQVNKQGNNFTREVAATIEPLGFNVRQQVLMSIMGVTKSEGDLGDIDVLAWRAGSTEVLMIECKRLRAAVSVRDVVERLDEYRGDRDDALGKHLRRVKWIQNNPASLAALTGIPVTSLRLRALLVTSDLVPMQFFSGAPISPTDIVAIDGLASALSSKTGR